MIPAPYGHSSYGAAADPSPRNLLPVVLTVGGLGVMGFRYDSVFGPGFKLKKMGKLSTGRGRDQASYWAGVLALVYGLKLLHDADALPWSGFDGYGGVAKKIARTEKKLARLQARLAKKEAKGRNRATARIQRRIDKLQAKLNALSGQAAGQGIPGFPGTPSPDIMPEPMPEPMPIDPMVYDDGGGTPSWLLPAAIGGGVLLVGAALLLSGGGGGRE